MSSLPPLVSPIMPLSDHNTATAVPRRHSEDIDSTCSTPFVSAPSSPGHGASSYFFSAPASPMHFLLSDEFSQKTKTSSSHYVPIFLTSDSESFEFEFSSRFSPNEHGGIGSMTSADELFFNGQIRPMKLSSHLQRPQDIVISPFVDLDFEESANVRGRDLKTRSAKYAHHRKARSMSPLSTTAQYEWRESKSIATNETKETESSQRRPSCSASSSRSSSSGRNSRKWIFLKDLLHRSKSEGRAKNKERFWSAISFSPAKEKKRSSSSSPSPSLSPSSSRDEKKGNGEIKKGKRTPATRKPVNGVCKRRVPPSAHEMHYTANRAQAEEMKKKTFLPYRQGLLGCLGFSSKSYGAFTGFTRNLNPISSR